MSLRAMKPKGDHGDQRGPEDQSDAKAAAPHGDGCLDRILLVATALLFCVIFGAAFWLAADYHVNPAWVFFAANSVLIVPVFVKDFRSQLKRPIFVAYLAVWAVLHGLVMVGLTFWIPFAYWPLFIIPELTIGIFLANYLFDVLPDRLGH